MTNASPWIVEQKWDITYQHTADPTTAEFLRALRDDAKLVGIECPNCHRVIAPARPVCDRCFCETEGWKDLGNAGVLELFTIVSLPIKGLPDPPYVIGYVKPDGADTSIPGFLEGLDLEDVSRAAAGLDIGSRVDINFRPERSGRITDLYFTLQNPTAG